MTYILGCAMRVLFPCGQPHALAQCITTTPNGTVELFTSAGNVSSTYNASALLQPPVIFAVIPTVWSTSEPTNVTITGDRCGSQSTL